ncbi:MAG: LTA synthase family protein [Hyphomicrobium sp.]
MQVIVAWIAALTSACLIERLTVPRGPGLMTGRSTGLLRYALFSSIFLGFLLLAWRPLFSAAATLVLVGTFVAISNGKVRYTYEPLVFSDLAFVIDIFRHATLFHTTFLGPLFVIAAACVVAAFITVWFAFEPPMAGGDTCRAVGLLVALLMSASLFWPSVRHRLAHRLVRLKPIPEAHRDVAAEGLVATLVTDALAWAGDDRLRRAASWGPPPYPVVEHSGGRPADLVVVVQCEAFMDFQRLRPDAPPLPNLDLARRRALCWGRLGSAFAGGYTMRTEFSFLSGRPNAAIGYDRYYPYLNAGAYADHCLPLRLRRAGYATAFIHPFHGHFFQRHRALPAIGFERMIMLDDFAGAEQVGGYVADAAVAERVIAEARDAQGPAFLFAATMENHEPWGTGRFEGQSDPITVYERHLANGDRLLGRLMAAFDDWPGTVVLAFYGDHVPLLKAFADPFPESDTDYVLLRLGSDLSQKAKPSAAARQIRLEASDLTWNVLASAGLPPRAIGSAPTEKG